MRDCDLRIFFSVDVRIVKKIEVPIYAYYNDLLLCTQSGLYSCVSELRYSVYDAYRIVYTYIYLLHNIRNIYIIYMRVPKGIIIITAFNRNFVFTAGRR